MKQPIAVVWCASLIICSGLQSPAYAEDQEARKARTTVKASELVLDVDIIGKLGVPLCQKVTIRGTWQKPGRRKCVGNLIFVVDTINGKPVPHADSPKTEVIFSIGDVEPLCSGRSMQRTSENAWDWAAAWGSNADDDPPEPQAGDVWELLGVETGGIHGMQVLWNEVGTAVQEEQGFLTTFCFARLRVLRQKP